jgi:hypothetical protein
MIGRRPPEQIEAPSRETGNPPSWTEQFGALVASSLFDLRQCLTDPLCAFHAWWLYEHGQDSEILDYLNDNFPKLLRAMCGGRTGSHSVATQPLVLLSGDHGSALKEYLLTIGWLLHVWRTEQPASGLPGSAAAHWCDQHPDIFERVQGAMRSQSRHFRTEEAAWEPYEWRPGGPAHLPDNKKLILVATKRFVGQRTWSQAAQTAAYALFGDFLGGKTEKIIFCGKCEKPFRPGKRVLFCSFKCAHSKSSTTSRHRIKADGRRKGLFSAAKSLSEWLQKPHRAGSDWRRMVERDFGLQASDGRHSRFMGEYIRAAQTPPGSPEREKLLRSHLSCSTENSQERENVQQQLEAFLKNVEEARNGQEKASASRR